MRWIISIVLFLNLFSCSNIKVLNERDFYSESFLAQIKSIHLIYRDGDKERALKKLNAIDDEALTRDEKAKKYNLKGVLLYSLGNTHEAIENFKFAKENTGKDLHLKNSIYLNLSSAYYRLEQIDSSESYLKEIVPGYLRESELKTYHKLSFTIGIIKNDDNSVVVSLLYLSKDFKTFEEMNNFKYREILVTSFSRLGRTQRAYILEKNEEKAPVAVAFLAQKEATYRFYQGDKAAAQDIVDWLEDHFSQFGPIRRFVKSFNTRAASVSKIRTQDIGILAPLSGKLSKYGKKVVMGASTALSAYSDKQKITLHVKDNKNNSFLAKKMVQELVLKHQVAVIIGGLFPHLAKEEYLEAKKYGVFFVSLSPVYLPRSEKSHLLLEASGSVESQVEALLRPEALNFLGKKAAILYPWSEQGKIYVEELWAAQSSDKLELKGVKHFKKGILDYRTPVKALLGLEFPRERSEEFKVWNEIKNINKRNVRIVNTLPPIVDFDWVFIPSVPKEALQIIPTFSFFDVKGVKFIGGPSWINKRLQRQKRNLKGRIYLIGNDTKDVGQNFVELYKRKNNKIPHFVDTISYEAMGVALSLLKGQDFSRREEMAKYLLNLKSMKGLTSQWSLRDQLWIKDMDILQIKSSGIDKLNLSVEQ